MDRTGFGAVIDRHASERNTGTNTVIARVAIILCAGLLASCNSGAAPSSGAAAGETSPSEQEPVASPKPAATPSATLGPAAPLTAAAMPLMPGVYNQVGNGCDDIPLATVATFTGEGFGGRSSAQCRFDPVHHVGQRWTGTQTCTDTYSGERRADPLTIRIKSRSSFVREDAYGTAEFMLCPDEKLSDWGGG